MKELELVKHLTGDYVDLSVFEVGEIYYIIDAEKNRSAIAVCLSVDYQDKAVFKIMEYLTGDWFFLTDHNLLVVSGKNVPLAKNLYIFPVCLNYQINPLTMKLTIAAEVQLHIS